MFSNEKYNLVVIIFFFYITLKVTLGEKKQYMVFMLKKNITTIGS